MEYSQPPNKRPSTMSQRRMMLMSMQEERNHVARNITGWSSFVIVVGVLGCVFLVIIGTFGVFIAQGSGKGYALLAVIVGLLCLLPTFFLGQMIRGFAEMLRTMGRIEDRLSEDE